MGKSMSVEQKYGQIQIQLQKPVYYPGEIIQGVVHCNIQQEMPTNIITLGIEGKEKVKMAKVMHQNNHNQHNSQHRQSRVEWEEDSEKICEYKIQLFNNKPGNFQPGHYSIPFQLGLPQKIPNSFDYRYRVESHKCKAQIKYKLIAAILLPNTKQGIKGSQKIHVREVFPFNQIGMTKKNLQKKISKEGITFEAKIDRDFFMFGEVAHAHIYCDNSKNSKPIKQLKWKLVQYIDFHSRNNKMKKQQRTRIKKVKVDGVEPKGKKSQEFKCEIKKALEKEVSNLVSVKEFYAVTPTFIFFSKDNKIDYEIKLFEHQNVKELNQSQFYNQQQNQYQANHQQQYYQQMQYHQTNMNQQQGQQNQAYPPNFAQNFNPQQNFQNNQQFPQNNYHDQSYHKHPSMNNQMPQNNNIAYQPWNNNQQNSNQQYPSQQNQQYPPNWNQQQPLQQNQQYPPQSNQQYPPQQNQQYSPQQNQQYPPQQNQQYPPKQDQQQNQQQQNQQYPPQQNQQYPPKQDQQQNQQYPPQQQNNQIPTGFNVNQNKEEPKNENQPQVSKIDQKLNEEQQNSLKNIQYPEFSGIDNDYNVDFSDLDKKNQLNQN